MTKKLGKYEVNKAKIRASIVICSYNGAHRISKTIESLLKQNYSKDLFEIIVVIDGSCDNTEDVVSNYNVRSIKCMRNQGISAARNIGLHAANGEVLVYIDDDCVADKNWLSEIVDSYRDIKVLGVGGLTLNTSNHTVVDKYLKASSYGSPMPLDFCASKTPFSRYAAYLKNSFKPLVGQHENITSVYEIYGANSSFLKSSVLAIQGYDESLASSEDSDICVRLLKNNPEGQIMFNRKAIIYHVDSLGLLAYIKKIYRRSRDTLMYNFKHDKIPPIFPHPIIMIVATSFIVTQYSYPVSICLMVLLPQFLYSWWVKGFIEARDVNMLVFPYIQLLTELVTELGFLIHIFTIRKK